jgi:hypothetical protein
MSLATIWRDKLAIPSLKHSSEKSQSTFAMGDIIHSTGWASDLTVRKLFSIHQQLSMDYQSHCGVSKLVMLPLRIIISL